MPIAAVVWEAGGDTNSPFDGGSTLAAKKLDLTRITLTWKTHRLKLPHASLAVQSTVVLPTANVEPDEGLQVIVTGPPELSVAVAVKFTTVPAGLTVWTVIFGGHVITGGMESPPTSAKTVPASKLSICRSPMPAAWRNAKVVTLALGGVSLAVTQFTVWLSLHG